MSSHANNQWQYQNENKWIDYDLIRNNEIEESIKSQKEYIFKIKQGPFATTHSIIDNRKNLDYKEGDDKFYQILKGNCIENNDCKKCKYPKGKHYRAVRRVPDFDGECCACMEESSEGKLLRCDNNHILCGGQQCMDALVTSQLDDIQMRASAGKLPVDVIKCPICQYIFKTQSLAPLLSEDIYIRLVRTRDSTVGALAQKELENQKIDHRTYIINNILNLNCPHCQTAFFDWNLACLKFECQSCKGNFCGCCLKKFNHDGNEYTHISDECEYNPRGKNSNERSVYLNTGRELQEFNEIHCKRRTKLVQQYLSQFDQQERINVIANLANEFRDLDINIQ